jgi:hypothetical protein
MRLGPVKHENENKQEASEDYPTAFAMTKAAVASKLPIKLDDPSQIDFFN